MDEHSEGHGRLVPKRAGWWYGRYKGAEPGVARITDGRRGLRAKGLGWSLWRRARGVDDDRWEWIAPVMGPRVTAAFMRFAAASEEEYRARKHRDADDPESCRALDEAKDTLDLATGLLRQTMEEVRAIPE